MNIISKILAEIKFTIPHEILTLAFSESNSNSWRNRAPISLDDEIITKVFRPRVLIDCNIVGGQPIMINLVNAYVKFYDTYNIVYELPPEATMNRTIVSVLSISYLPFIGGYNMNGFGLATGVSNITNGSGINNISMAAQKVGDSFSNVPNISNANIEIIGHNTLLVKDTVRATNGYQIRCVVANEENLNNINPRAYQYFVKLTQLAVKSYIYNKLLIQLDKAYLSGGQDLSSVKSYIDGLSDAEQMYQDYLAQNIQAVSFMNDNETYTRFLRLQVNPGI